MVYTEYKLYNQLKIRLLFFISSLILLKLSYFDSSKVEELHKHKTKYLPISLLPSLI